MLPHRVVRLALAALVAIAGAGCRSGGSGGDGASSDAPPTSEDAAPAEIAVQEGIEYGSAEIGAPAGTVPLLLDLYRPAGEADEPRPVVVVIHGGGFVGQSRTDEGIVRIARGLAEQGIVAASIDYRLLDQHPVPSERVAALSAVAPEGDLFATMVTAADDTLAAITYLTDHADELGIDPDRLGLVGSSAGAITADHVAYALDDQGIDAPDITFVGSLWGGMFLPGELGVGEPALYAVHGDADERVPVTLTDDLAARADAERVPVEYHRIPGGRHGYQGSQFFTYDVDGSGTTPFDRLLAFAASAFA